MEKAVKKLNLDFKTDPSLLSNHGLLYRRGIRYKTEKNATVEISFLNYWRIEGQKSKASLYLYFIHETDLESLRFYINGLNLEK